MKLAIGCDDAAYEMKEIIKQYLKDTRGIVFNDVGICKSDSEIYYPEIAKRVSNLIQNDKNDIEFGILICGTGIGMALTANKFKGIRAAVCHDSYSAKRAKLSNNTNIIAMGARIIGPELAKDLVDIWLDSEYAGGRSAPKVVLVEEYEEDNFI